MDEHEFLLKLEQRAQEQEALMQKMLMSKAVFSISLWLGRHPWRFIIPISIFITIFFYSLFGERYINLILWIFGKV